MDRTKDPMNIKTVFRYRGWLFGYESPKMENGFGLFSGLAIFFFVMYLINFSYYQNISENFGVLIFLFLLFYFVFHFYYLKFLSIGSEIGEFFVLSERYCRIINDSLISFALTIVVVWVSLSICFLFIDPICKNFTLFKDEFEGLCADFDRGDIPAQLMYHSDVLWLSGILYAFSVVVVGVLTAVSLIRNRKFIYYSYFDLLSNLRCVGFCGFYFLYVLSFVLIPEFVGIKHRNFNYPLVSEVKREILLNIFLIIPTGVVLFIFFLTSISVAVLISIEFLDERSSNADSA